MPDGPACCAPGEKRKDESDLGADARAGGIEPVDGRKGIDSFDTIPHRELLQCVARRIVDRDMVGTGEGTGAD